MNLFFKILIGIPITFISLWLLVALLQILGVIFDNRYKHPNVAGTTVGVLVLLIIIVLVFFF